MSNNTASIFSLTCLQCDAGNEIQSEQEAERLGWQELKSDPDGLAWTYVGVCPDCAPVWFETNKLNDAE